MPDVQAAATPTAVARLTATLTYSRAGEPVLRETFAS